eukprot:632181-Rhodomonas_salina.1
MQGKVRQSVMDEGRQLGRVREGGRESERASERAERKGASEELRRLWVDRNHRATGGNALWRERQRERQKRRARRCSHLKFSASSSMAFSFGSAMACISAMCSRSVSWK